MAGNESGATIEAKDEVPSSRLRELGRRFAGTLARIKS
jgi:hypothetical protein